MKIQPYIHKLEHSPVYKEFQQKYKDAFLIAGFFVIDFETGQHLHQIDYYVPSQKKVAAFTLDKNVMVQLLKTLDKKMPEKLNIKTKTDLEALHGIVQDEMKNRNITQEIKKMIAVVQNVKGKVIWNVNCILTGMDVLKVHVEDTTQTILRMEKISILDIIKKLPAPAEMQQQPGQEVQQDASKKLEQLDKLKQAIEKEEAELKKQESSKPKALKSKKKQKAQEQEEAPETIAIEQIEEE